MSDDQDGCEWVSVSSGTGLPGCPGPKAVKRLCVVCVIINCSLCTVIHNIEQSCTGSLHSQFSFFDTRQEVSSM